MYYENLVTKRNIRVGMECWVAIDDRPFDGCQVNKAIITEVFDDHYLYLDTEIGIDNVWGLYDTDLAFDSVAVFTDEQSAIDWLKG